MGAFPARAGQPPCGARASMISTKSTKKGDGVRPGREANPFAAAHCQSILTDSAWRPGRAPWDPLPVQRPGNLVDPEHTVFLQPG